MSEQKSVAIRPDTAMLATLEKLKPQLRDALPRSMDADRFARVVMTEIRRNPKLLECPPQSFLAAVFTSAQLGLEIGSHLGEAFVIPYKQRGTPIATLVVGYKGMVKLVWESEQIVSLTDAVVHAKDHIEYLRGDEEKIIHRPHVPPRELLEKQALGKSLSKDEREALTAGPSIAYYAMIDTKGGGKRRAFAWANEIREHHEKHRRGEDRDDSVWVTNFDAMALKTVIARACKLAPRAVEKPSLQQAIALDELADAGVDQGLMLPEAVTAEPKGLSVASFTSAETVSATDDSAPSGGKGGV